MASHGLLARFEQGDELLAAARALRARGYRRLEAYSPHPVEGLAEVLAPPPKHLPVIALAAAAAAAVGAYGLQWYSSVVAYPFVVGGKPLGAWPPFMLVCAAMAILGAATVALVGMLAGNRLPQLYHPAFNVAGFERATQDGYFLMVAASDARFDATATGRLLRELAAADVAEAPE